MSHLCLTAHFSALIKDIFTQGKTQKDPLPCPTHDGICTLTFLEWSIIFKFSLWKWFYFMKYFRFLLFSLSSIKLRHIPNTDLYGFPSFRTGLSESLCGRVQRFKNVFVVHLTLIQHCKSTILQWIFFSYFKKIR